PGVAGQPRVAAGGDRVAGLLHGGHVRPHDAVGAEVEGLLGVPLGLFGAVGGGAGPRGGGGGGGSGPGGGGPGPRGVGGGRRDRWMRPRSSGYWRLSRSAGTSRGLCSASNTPPS